MPRTLRTTTRCSASTCAKAEADEAVRASDTDWTIVRPGPLTDDPGSGRVRIETEPFRASVAREDVAAVLAQLLHGSLGSHRVLYLGGGEEAIDEALAAADG